MTVGSPLSIALALLALLGICVLTLTLVRVPVRTDAVVAAVRALVQLALVALVIGWVFAHPAGVVLYLTLMLSTAAVTSVRRIGCGLRRLPVLLAAIGGGALAVALPVLASGALTASAQTLVPFTAQIIGGSMTAASLSGGRLRDDVAGEWDVVEGWLALGARPRQAVLFHARRAVARALVPALDQTRSAGLVVLPGAFVGLLLGGATPLQAAQVQLIVLVGLLAAEAVSSSVTVLLLSPWVGSQRPAVR